MNKLALSACALAGAAFLALAPARAQAVPPAIAAAVADPGRPAADLALDATRKPAGALAFAGVKPGNYELICLPLRIEKGDAGPCRVILRK